VNKKTLQGVSFRSEKWAATKGEMVENRGHPSKSFKLRCVERSGPGFRRKAYLSLGPPRACYAKVHARGSASSPFQSRRHRASCPTKRNPVSPPSTTFPAVKATGSTPLRGECRIPLNSLIMNVSFEKRDGTSAYRLMAVSTAVNRPWPSEKEKAGLGGTVIC
jgi:hypothetical protein